MPRSQRDSGAKPTIAGNDPAGVEYGPAGRVASGAERKPMLGAGVLFARLLGVEIVGVEAAAKILGHLRAWNEQDMLAPESTAAALVTGQCVNPPLRRVVVACPTFWTG